MSAWNPRFVASWLCLKQHGPNKAIVVKIHPGVTDPGRNIARMYEGWLGDRKVYEPSDEFQVGQVIRL